MEEERHTIQELADKYGISYQAVSQRIKKENLEVIDKNGKKTLTKDTYTKLIDFYENRNKSESQIIVVKNDLEEKNNQLDNEILKLKIESIIRELDTTKKDVEFWQRMYIQKDQKLNEVYEEHIKKLTQPKQKKLPFWKRK